MWVLIVLMTTGSAGGGATLTMQDFSNLDACKSAAASVQSLAPTRFSVRWTCTRKG